MKWAQLTDTGLVRPLNEDSLCVVPELGLLPLPDGMGGPYGRRDCQQGSAGCIAAIELGPQDEKRGTSEVALVSACANGPTGRSTSWPAATSGGQVWVLLLQLA